MKLTNTQYIKKGSLTSVGFVDLIHDRASFRNKEGFSYNVRNMEVFKADKTISGVTLKVSIEQMPESIITAAVLVWHIKDKFCAAFYHGENITEMVDSAEIEKKLICFGNI